MQNKTVILGVGNIYRRDDGVGIEVVKQLQSQNVPSIEPIIGGTDGLALFDIISEYKRAIIVDAVEMRETPGTVKLFKPQEAKIKIHRDAISTHGFGVADVLSLLERMDVETKIEILGVQPLDVSFGEGLTESIKSKVPEIIGLIKCVTQYQQK